MEEVFIDMRKQDEQISKHFNKDIVSIWDLLMVIEELDDEIENLNEKYEDLEQDLQDNYKPIPPAEQYGIDERDFI